MESLKEKGITEAVKRTLSLDEFIKRFDPPYALKLISGNIGTEGKKLTLPLYMAMFL